MDHNIEIEGMQINTTGANSKQTYRIYGLDKHVACCTEGVLYFARACHNRTGHRAVVAVRVSFLYKHYILEQAEKNNNKLLV